MCRRLCLASRTSRASSGAAIDAPASFAAPLGDGEDSSWTGAYEAALEKHGATPWSKGGVPLAPIGVAAHRLSGGAASLSRGSWPRGACAQGSE